MMNKFIVAVALALTSVFAFAKPVAYKDFNDGRVYLTDEQGSCPDQTLTWKFEPAVQGQIPEEALKGCFVIAGGDVILFLADGMTPVTIIPQTAFEHISKAKI